MAYRILVVDDDPKVLRTAAATVEALGFAAAAVSSPRAALELAREHPPFQVALLDVFLGDAFGHDLAEELVILQPDLKVLFMSGGVGGIFLASKRPGATLLPKPFSRDDLRRALEALLPPSA